MLNKNIFYTILLNVVNIIYPIITFPYVSRVLGADGVGAVVFVSTFALYFALVSSIGLPLYGVREIAKKKDDSVGLNKTVTELLLLSFCSNIIVLLAYFFIVLYFPYFKDKRLFYLLCSLIVFFNGISVEWFFQGIEKFKMIAVRSAIVKIFALILLFFIVKTAADTLNYLLLVIFSIVGNTIYNIFVLFRNIKLDFSGISIKKHIRPITFVYFYTLSTSVYTMLDTIFLGFYSTDSYVGYYSAGVRLAKVSIPFVTATGIALLPQSSKNYHEKNNSEFLRLVSYSFNYIFVLAIPISIGMLLFSKELLVLFSGAGFIKGVIVMQILSFMPLVIGLGYLFGIQILVGAGKEREILYSVVIGMVINVLLNFILVPRYLHIGAAVSNIVCEVIITAAYMFFVSKHFDLKKIVNLRVIYTTIISTIPFFIISFILKSLWNNNLLIVGVGVPSCAISYYIGLSLFKDNVIINFNRALVQKINILWSRFQ